MKSLLIKYWVLLAAAILTTNGLYAADSLELKKGDHILFYGDSLTDQARGPKGWVTIVRETLKEKHPDEKDFQAALDQYRKDNPIPRGNIHDVVDHIEHIIKVAGIDHVGIGSDFDGIDSTPEGLEDVSKYPFITQELLNRGYKPEQIRKLLGENFLRVFRAVEKVAEKK